MRSIAIASGKGGVGKTTSAINIAHAISRHRKRTLLVDGNLSTPNIHVYLGWPILKNSLTQVLRSESSYKDAIYTHESGLRILPSLTSAADIRDLKHEKLSEVVADLESEADVILLDSAAGLGREALGAISACDEVLIVTNPELGAVLDAQKTVQLAHEMGKTLLGVVLNKVRNDRHELKVADVEKLLDLPVIAVVPFDEAIRKSLTKKGPVTHTFPDSRAGREFTDLSALLLGKKYMDLVSRKKSLKDYALKKLGFL